MKKSFLTLLFVLTTLANSYAQVPYFDGHKWGLVNKTGKITVKPIYDDLPIVVLRLEKKPIYKVVKNDAVQLVNRYGNIVLSGHDNYQSLNASTIRVTKHKKIGIYNIDKKEYIVKPKYDSLSWDYLAKAYYKVELNGKKSIINKQGEELIPWDDYKKIEIVTYNDETLIVARYFSDSFNVYNYKGETIDNYSTSSLSLYSIDVSSDEELVSHHLSYRNNNYAVKDQKNKIIFESSIPKNEIKLERLLFDTIGTAENKRYSFIAIYKEKHKFGLFDILYKETITKASYDSFKEINYGYANNKHALVAQNSLFGILNFQETEDANYVANHITSVQYVPTKFKSIKKLDEKFPRLIFELPNGYRCFHYYDDKAEKIKFYLPKKISKMYQL